MLRRLSPIHKVDRVTAPTIVLHGANDTNVPVVEAEQVVDSLKKRGIAGRVRALPRRGARLEEDAEPRPLRGRA